MADEIAWVIVHRNVTPGGPNYWCGNGWSIDNQRAIRFAREIDAQRTLAGFDEDDPLPNEQPHRVEEHMWLDGPRSPSVSGSPAPSTERLRGWRDIATAPKDGGEFLGFGGGIDGQARIQVVRWNDRVGCWQTDTVSLEDWDDQAEGYSRPTHWMPLPPSPEIPENDQ